MKPLLKCLKDLEIKVEVLILNPGEKTKSWFNLKKVVEWLISNQIERNDFVVSLGGGAMGIAPCCLLNHKTWNKQLCTYMPTYISCLKLIDSIGGKTGINSLQGKNLVGTFHQPSLILSDISYLKTLKRESFYLEKLK